MADDTLDLLCSLLTGAAYRTTVVQSSGNHPRVRYSERILRQRLADLEASIGANMRRLSPSEASQDQLDVNHPKIQALAVVGALGRFPWIVATKATGAGAAQGPDVTNIYLELGEWWAIRSLLDFRPLEKDALDERASSHEFLYRTTAQSIRYAWAAREIATRLASAVQASPQAARALPELTVKAVNDLLDAARTSIMGGPLALSVQAQDLASTIAISAGANASRPLNGLMTSQEIQTTPWVRFSSGVIAPAAPREAIFGLDVSLFALVERRLRSLDDAKLTKGTLFEVVSERCLGEALRSLPTSPNLEKGVRVSTTDKGQLDIALGDPVSVIGECKAMVTASMGSVGKDFAGQISKGVKQVRLRLKAAVDDGVDIRDSKNRLYKADTNLCGVVVVMHAYAGAGTSPEMLKLLPDQPATKFPVIVSDLHSWLLITHALGSVRSLQDYLNFRARIIKLENTACEEVDLLILYLSPDRESKVRKATFAVAAGRKSPLLRGTAIMLRVALARGKPTSARSWSLALFEDAEVR